VTEKVRPCPIPIAWHGGSKRSRGDAKLTAERALAEVTATTPPSAGRWMGLVWPACFGGAGWLYGVHDGYIEPAATDQRDLLKRRLVLATTEGAVEGGTTSSKRSCPSRHPAQVRASHGHPVYSAWSLQCGTVPRAEPAPPLTGHDRVEGATQLTC
jgi:hypothetical protein